MWGKSLKPRASAWNMSFIFEWVTFTAKLHNESLHSKDNNIFFYSKHIIYQLLFKIYWLGSWFCRKCVTKSTQGLSVQMRQLVLVPLCRLRAAHQYCAEWGSPFRVCCAPEVSGEVPGTAGHPLLLQGIKGLKHTHEPVYSASSPKGDSKRQQ